MPEQENDYYELEEPCNKVHESNPKFDTMVNVGIKEMARDAEANASEEGTQEEEPIPLLFVDVNLGEGKMDRIVLYEGDQPETIAEEFAKEHDLDSGMTKKLTDLLNQQMAGVLSKIEEEGESEER